MSSECLKLISAANAELTRFLERASSLSSGPAGDKDQTLSEIQTLLPSLAAAVESAGRALSESGFSKDMGEDSKKAIDLYAANLRRLKSLLPALQASVEIHRNRLTSDAQKIKETLAWTSILKLTTTG